MKNSLIKVLSFVMALAMIVGCFSAITFSAAEHTHTKGKQVGDPVPATCAKIGYTLYECATCGVTYPDDVVPKATSHTGIVEVPATDATCSYPAMTAGKTCTDCNTVIEAQKPVDGSKPLGHQFVGAHKGNICDLVYYYTCATCGKTAEECYDAESKDAFLVANNYFGNDINSYKAFFADSSKATGHAWNYVVKTDAEICKDGLTVRTCKTCGTSEEITITAPHDFSATFAPCEPYSGHKCALCGKHAPDAVDKEPAHNTVRVTEMNSTIQNMGYTAVEKAATCTVDGYYFVRCTLCNAYIKKTVTASHNFGATKLEGGKTTGNAEYCYTATAYVRTCTVCGVKETIPHEAAVPHSFKSVVTDPTCTTEGFTTTTCTNLGCTYSVISNYTAALGHSFGDWTYVGSAQDHTSVYKKVAKCTRPGCDETKEEVIREAVASAPAGTTLINGHYYNVDNKPDIVVPANCTTPAYAAYLCVIDGCGATTPINGSVDDSTINDIKDPSRHDESQLIPLEAKSKNPTCTSDGYAKFFCPTCQVEVTKTLPATGHGALTQVIKDANGKVTQNLAKVPATCTSTGKTDGWACSICKAIVTPQQTTPIDPDNHKVSKNGTLVDASYVTISTKSPTCTSNGYTTVFYECCKKYVNINETPAVPGAHTYETVKYKAPVCGVNGNHAYLECKECKAISRDVVCECENVKHTVDVRIEIPYTSATHDFVLTTKEVPETCVTPGVGAIYTCKYCSTTQGGASIPAHGNAFIVKYEENSTLKAQGINGINKPATHTDKGIKAGTYCSKCDAVAGSDKGVNDETWVIDALGHDASFATPTVINRKGTGYDCTQPTYNVYTCSCGAVKADGFVAAVASKHEYEAVWHKYTVSTDGKKLLLDGVDTGKYACAADASTYEYRDCQNCDQREIKNEKAPVNHYDLVNGSKVTILLDCQNAAKSVGLVCEICNQEFSKDYVDTHVTHNPAYSTKNATCTEAGYMLKFCLDCGEYLDVNDKVPADKKDALNIVTPALGHNPYTLAGVINTEVVKYVVEEKAATYSTDGYVKYMCNRCNEVVTYVIPAKTGIEFGMTATPGFTGSQVAVTVTASAKDFKFQTLTLRVGYDSGLALSTDKKAELNYAFPANDNVTVRVKDNGGYALVTIYAPNSVETGKPVNTTFNGDNEAIVTLYFDVLPYASGAQLDLKIDEIYDAVEDKKITDVAGNDTLLPNGQLKDFATTLIGDANGDGYIDAADSVAVMEANYTATYNAKLDFNRDGTVDLDDHMALMNYYTSDRSYYDFLILLGVDYMDYVNNYDLRVDLDGDRTITDNDRNRIAIELVDDLKDFYLEGSHGFAVDVEWIIDDIVEDLLDDGLRNGSN